MGKRALAQSLARELGPHGVHVSHVVVDGAVDNPNTRQFFAGKHPEMAEMFEEKSKVDGLIQPASVAELYLQLHNQVREGESLLSTLRCSGQDSVDPRGGHQALAGELLE